MKFIHLADVHLGAERFENDEENNARQQQVWDTFVSTVEDAGQEGVDLLLIAGDLFDVPPALEDLQDINALFARIPQVRVVLIAGEADYISQGSAWLEMKWNKNVAFLASRSCECVRFPEINTDVYGMSYYGSTLPEAVCSSLSPMDKHKTNILLAHGGDADHIPMNPKELEKSGFDYIALGHVHRPSALVHKKAIYSGSLEPLGESETGQHGYIMGEAKGHRVKLEFVPKAKMRFSRKAAAAENMEAAGIPETMTEPREVPTEEPVRGEERESFRIISLEPKGFGRFQDHIMKVRPGINVIYGGNETGKSTLTAFVKDMLYGISARGGRKGRDEYSLREPKDGDGTFAGAMNVEVDGVEYRIERSFLKNHKSVSVTRVADERAVNLDGHEPGELLTGLTESEFMATVLVQQGAESSFEQLEEMAGLYLTDPQAEGESNPAEVLAALMRAKASAQEKVRMAELSVRMAEASRRQQFKKGRIKLKGNLEQFVLLWAVLSILIAIVGACSVVLAEGIPARILFLIMTLCFGALGAMLFIFWRDSRGRGADKAFISAQRVSEEAVEEVTEAGQEYIDSFRQEVYAIERKIRNMREGEEYQIFEENRAFRAELGSALAALTQERYTEAVLDEDGSIRVMSGDALVYPQMLGAGTAAQINLALRMTTADYMTGRSLPLILDEAFVFYDNEAVEDAVRYLERSGRQVILFTAQTREKQILDRIRSAR